MKDQETIKPATEMVEEVTPKTEKPRFDPVISKITKPLKPQGVHAGAISIGVTIKGSF